MNRPTKFAVAALALAASTVFAGTPRVPTPVPAPTTNVIDPIDPGANYAVVDVGSRAPDFSFDAQGRSLRLRDLRAQGHVLLVIAPEDAQMVALENERAALLALGVVPVAVIDQRAGACTATARRLGLGYSIVPDPRGVIAAQFNAVDEGSGADQAAWFVLDRAGRVRDLAHGTWPGRPWAAVAREALDLPDPSAPANASMHAR